MVRICPKCNYARKPADECPEWQCPACQVAYNKVGASTSVDHARRAQVSAAQKPSSPGAAKWILLALAAGAGIWLSKPIWQKAPAHTPAPALATGQPAVTMYSAEWCGYCTAAREMFIANDIPYVELDVEKTTAGYEGHKKLGGNGVPLIVVGDDVMHGYNEQDLRRLLKPWMQEGS